MTATWFSGVTLKLEIGWADSPSVDLATTTWTDESLRVRSITCRRGRDDELDTFQAGTMTIVLSNADRRFDPNYTAGSLYGNLLPMRRVRLSVTYSAVDYPIWCGFIDDLPQEYDIGGRDATVTISCTDGFKVLSLLKLPESVYAVEVAADEPDIWLRLGEQSGTVAFDSSGNGADGTYVGGATFGSRVGLIVGGTDNAIEFDGVDDAVRCYHPVTAFPFTFECWVQGSDITTASLFSQLSRVYPAAGSSRLTVSISTGGISAQLAHGGNSTQSVSNETVDDGHPHHVAVCFQSGSAAAIIYIDGVQATYGTFTATGTSELPPADYFEVGGLGVSGPGPIDAITIDEFALYRGVDLAVPPWTPLSRYEFGSDPWTGDTSGERIERLLDIAGWPSADRTVATGVSTMQAQTLGSQATLTALQDIEASEQGQLFMGGDGEVIFRDRHWRFENSLALTSNATFGDSGSELRYADIVTDGGETLIFNHIRASRDGGATVDVTDSTSIGKFFERTDEVTGLQNESDLEVRDLASWRLATHANPIQRVTVLEVKPRKIDQATSLFPQVLARDIGHRITVKRRPQNVGSALTYTCLIEGIEHIITAEGDWTTRWYLSAADSQPTVQPLVLDDATYGLLDTNVLAY